MRRLWARYAGGPAELAATIACFAIAAAAVVGWTQQPQLENVLIWFGAAIVLHDVVLLPVYSLVDRVMIGPLPRRLGAHVRVPALISLLVLAVVFPVVLGYGARTERGASGIAEHGYLARWLVLAGVLFALSGLAYAVGSARRRRARAPRPPRAPQPPRPPRSAQDA